MDNKTRIFSKLLQKMIEKFNDRKMHNYPIAQLLLFCYANFNDKNLAYPNSVAP